MQTHVTMWLDVLFEVEEEPPFAPRNIRDEAGHLTVVIRSQFKLAGGTKARSPLRTWWNSLCKQVSVDIPTVGPHALQQNGWFLHDSRVVETEASLENKMVDTGVAILQTLLAMVEAQGLKLTKS